MPDKIAPPPENRYTAQSRMRRTNIVKDPPPHPVIYKLSIDVICCQKCHVEWSLWQFERKSMMWIRHKPPVQCPRCKSPRYDLPPSPRIGRTFVKNAKPESGSRND